MARVTFAQVQIPVVHIRVQTNGPEHLREQILKEMKGPNPKKIIVKVPSIIKVSFVLEVLNNIVEKDEGGICYRDYGFFIDSGLDQFYPVGELLAFVIVYDPQKRLPRNPLTPDNPDDLHIIGSLKSSDYLMNIMKSFLFLLGKKEKSNERVSNLYYANPDPRKFVEITLGALRMMRLTPGKISWGSVQLDYKAIPWLAVSLYIENPRKG